MKRLLIISFIIAIPISVLAESDRPVRRPINDATNRQPIEAMRQRTVKKQPAKLSELPTLKASGPKQAFEFHQELLQQRIDRLQTNTIIPADQRDSLIAKFTEELTWMQEKHSELEAATTAEARSTIRQEIIEHVHSTQAERRQQLADAVNLPQRSPSELAQQISERFTNISQHLSDRGKDTTDLDIAIQSYQEAVSELDSRYAAVQQDKTVEHLQELRDSVKAVREAATAVRNVVESLLSN